MPGNGLDGVRNGSQEVSAGKTPFLFIHGEKDVFVPCWMCEEIYKNCAAPKTKLIVKDAATERAIIRIRQHMKRPLIHLSEE